MNRMQAQTETVRAVLEVLAESLGIDLKQRPMDVSTRLFGAMPEFDSMAVMVVVTALERKFEIAIDDADLTAQLFDTVGSLAVFVEKARNGV